MRILAAGDWYMPPDHFREAFVALERSHEICYAEMSDDPAFVPVTPSERRLKEYLGSPAQLTRYMEGVAVLVIHGAPVTDRVLDASRDLRLVCCARGGPVNVDVGAVTARGLPLVNTPGKNAEAVADLTLCLLVMLARGVPRALGFIDDGNEPGGNWGGAKFLGCDLRGHTLGLVGCGQVGRRVARRAAAFGMVVLAFDPYVRTDPVEQVETLEELLTRADFVSLHARATPENERLLDARAFGAMRQDAFLINTARESLVDEEALITMLESNRLAGAALDVFDPSLLRRRERLARPEKLILTPHIGGATTETLQQGAQMIAEEVARFAADEPLVHIVNRAEVTA